MLSGVEEKLGQGKLKRDAQVLADAVISKVADEV